MRLFHCFLHVVSYRFFSLKAIAVQKPAGRVHTSEDVDPSRVPKTETDKNAADKAQQIPDFMFATLVLLDR